MIFNSSDPDNECLGQEKSQVQPQGSVSNREISVDSTRYAPRRGPSSDEKAARIVVSWNRWFCLKPEETCRQGGRVLGTINLRHGGRKPRRLSLHSDFQNDREWWDVQWGDLTRDVFLGIKSTGRMETRLVFRSWI